MWPAGFYDSQVGGLLGISKIVWFMETGKDRTRGRRSVIAKATGPCRVRQARAALAADASCEAGPHRESGLRLGCPGSGSRAGVGTKARAGSGSFPALFLPLAVGLVERRKADSTC